jgi:plastocyanin
VNRVLALVVLLAALATLGAAVGSAAPSQSPTLFGSIGDDGISVRDASGARVTKLDPGTYDLEVDDSSDFHNFHLQGPGVDVATGVDFVGKRSFAITLSDGSYIYICDVHPISLRGSFSVGNVPAPEPAPKPTPGVVTPASKLVLTSGPGFTITLKTSAGAAVKKLKTGTYTVAVRDRARIHDAHLVAPGFDRRTTVPFVGTQTWRVKLAKPGTLRFLCDPHAAQGMRGSATIVRRP